VFGLVKKIVSAVFPATNRAARILQVFEKHRQELRDDFFALAAASGKPRGLRWKACDWLDTFTMVLDADTGMHTLFCGVNLSFEAVEGGDMEDVDAVSMVRDATAVFHHHNNRWGSGGRVLFNMDPQTAARVMANGQTLVRSSTEI
jgi:hypothetical protein